MTYVARFRDKLSTTMFGPYVEGPSKSFQKLVASYVPHPRSLQEAWVIEGAKNRCVVLMEGDPPTTTGRMSFLGFNQATEQLQKDADRRERTAGEEGITVTDEEMAAK